MRLFLIRHGETDANVALMGSRGGLSAGDGLYEVGGGSDVPLNTHGREQSVVAAQQLPDHIDVLFSSPLLRAHETAKIIARERHIPEQGIIISDALTEYRMGNLDGTPSEVILEKYGIDTRTVGSNCTYDYRPFGGESWEDIRDRVELFLEMLKRDYADKTVVVATSGGIVRMAHKILLAGVAPHIFSKLKIPNGSVHELII